MTERVKLLNWSVEKWEGIFDAKDAYKDQGTSDCPLCLTYFNRKHPTDGSYCYGCPVREFTGMTGCAGTPYEGFQNALHALEKENEDAGIDDDYSPWSGDIEEYVMGEITFLRNLARFEDLIGSYIERHK